MGANIAGIYGAQIFRSDDAPRYRRGFSINIGVLTLGLVLAAVRFVDDRWYRRRNADVSLSNSNDSSNEENDDTQTPENKNEKLPTLGFEKQPQQPLGTAAAN